MLFLANIGGAMARCLKFSYSRVCCMWCRARRKNSEEKFSIIPENSDAKIAVSDTNEESNTTPEESKIAPENSNITPVESNIPPEKSSTGCYE